MMKLSDFKGEDALDVLADILEPAAEIMSDQAVVEIAKNGKSIAKLAKVVIKNHKKAVIEILARLESAEGEDPEEYVKTLSVFTLPPKVLSLLNDPELKAVFKSQAQTTQEASSGPATENTEAQGA